MNNEKTIFLAEYLPTCEKSLVARSQAKRVVANLDKFHTILLDFDHVQAIGQGFADEVFRVFQNQHQDIEIIPTNANDDIKKMINRVIATAKMNKG